MAVRVDQVLVACVVAQFDPTTLCCIQQVSQGVCMMDVELQVQKSTSLWQHHEDMLHMRSIV